MHPLYLEQQPEGGEAAGATSTSVESVLAGALFGGGGGDSGGGLAALLGGNVEEAAVSADASADSEAAAMATIASATVGRGAGLSQRFDPPRCTSTAFLPVLMSGIEGELAAALTRQLTQHGISSERIMVAEY